MHKSVLAPAILALAVSGSVHAQSNLSRTTRGDALGWCGDVLEFSVDAHSESRLGKDGMASIERAAAAWLGVDGAPAILVVREADAGMAARGHVEWVDQWDREEAHLAVTDLSYFGNDGLIDYASISINAQNPWAMTPDGMGAWQYDMESVMIHEFGHVLGLDHNDDVDSVMRPKANKGSANLEPSQDDVDALVDNYAVARTCRKTGAERYVAPGLTCSAAPGPVSSGGMATVLAMAAIVLTFVRRRLCRSQLRGESVTL